MAKSIIKSPRFNRHGGIDVDLWSERDGEHIPYTIAKEPTNPTDQVILSLAKEMGPKPYVAPEPVVTVQEVTRECNRLLSRGVEYKNKLFRVDPTSLSRIASAAVTAQVWMFNQGDPKSLRWLDEEEDFTWPTARGTWVRLSAQDMIDLNKAAILYTRTLSRAASDLVKKKKIPLDYAEQLALIAG